MHRRAGIRPSVFEQNHSRGSTNRWAGTRVFVETIFGRGAWHSGCRGSPAPPGVAVVCRRRRRLVDQLGRGEKAADEVGQPAGVLDDARGLAGQIGLTGLARGAFEYLYSGVQDGAVCAARARRPR